MHVEGRRWFQNKSTVHPKTLAPIKYALGSLCWQCGKLVEAFPLLTVQQIKEKLKDPSEIVFQVRWDSAKKRLEAVTSDIGDDPFKIALHHHSVTGLRIEWPRAFVDSSDFLTHFGLECDDKALKLKVVEVNDPELVPHRGVLIMRDQIDPSLPHCRAVLYTDEKTNLIDFILDKGEALHSRHGLDMQKYQIGQDGRNRSEGLSLKNTLIVPHYQDLKKAAADIQSDRKLQEAERLKQLALADAAEAAAMRGDAAARRALEMAAAVGTVESSSRLNRRTEAECDNPAAPPTKRSRVDSAGGATGAASRAARGGTRTSARASSAGRSEALSTPPAKLAQSRQSGSTLAGRSSEVQAGSRRADGTISTRKPKAGSAESTLFASDGCFGDSASLAAAAIGDVPEELHELIYFIMGPKNYSPGREIRWVV